jgi:GDP-4-dehydro-6-deoxy-D-mannose reductase
VQNVFVTGAGGFVGSKLISALQQAGCDVVAGVRNRARKLAFERENQHALVCDVTDPINVARAIASVRPDGVVHLAGPAIPGAAATDPLDAYQGIVTSWANVLDGVRRATPRAKVVLASASDVYGEAGADGHPLAESTTPAPVTTFGSLKLAAENIAATFFRDYHLNISIARPFQYTGPGQPSGFYFATAAARLADDEGIDGNVLRWPDLDLQRDVLHVDDVVSAYVRLLQDGQPNETYNICSGEAVTCRSLLEQMIAATGRRVELEPLRVESDQPAIACLCGDPSKLQGLGWEAQQSAASAVAGLMESCRGSLAGAN